MHRLAVSLIVVAGLMGPAFSWSQFPESERSGVIEEVELASSSLIVSGTRYRVALDAKVEINGTYGAFSLLSRGMKVRFVCRLISDQEREIVQLETLPSGFVLEQA